MCVFSMCICACVHFSVVIKWWHFARVYFSSELSFLHLIGFLHTVCVLLAPNIVNFAVEITSLH